MKDVAFIGALIALAALAVVGFAAWIWIVQWAWNALVPSVFHGPSIDLIQAAAVVVFLAALSGGTRYVRSDR